ncbi:MAG: exo-beta-N-acetylmuramidase NamZ domain-containing protein, partial [Chlamydiota bacterium]
MQILILFFLIISNSLFAAIAPKISLGVDLFFKDALYENLKGKRIGLLTNHTGVDGQMRSTIQLFRDHEGVYELVALFSPEHGLQGQHYAWESVSHGDDKGLPVYSLHGQTRRPTPEMLKGIDLIVYDMQCTGVRAYTYPTTLFYVMEEAAKMGIEVIVLDRPNPINGLIVDGPMPPAY